MKIRELVFEWLCGILTVTAFLLQYTVFGQCPEKSTVAAILAAAEQQGPLHGREKLQALYNLKKQLDDCHATKDTQYAAVLEKIGYAESHVNKNYNAAINHTRQALAIDLSAGQAGVMPSIRAYYNLGQFYDAMTLFDASLNYYDSTITLAGSNPFADSFFLEAQLYKVYIFFRRGDYQKGVEESILGIRESLNRKDSSYYLYFLNQKAQCHFFQKQLNESLQAVSAAKQLAIELQNPFQLASALKMEAYVFAEKREFPIAERSFLQCIEVRIPTKRFGQLAGDYNDLGNFYRDNLHAYAKAKKAYKSGLTYAAKNADSVRLCRINVNLGKVFFWEKNYQEVSRIYLKAARYLKLNVTGNFLLNDAVGKINMLGNKELVLIMFDTKTELLLSMYKQNGDKKYLTATLEAARLFDSLITQARHDQLGEQSKLYWRDRTRNFFANALEACWLANNNALAFFFMEKSRAVLLNDKLNELGASSRLPEKEMMIQQEFYSRLINLRQKISSADKNSTDYQKQQEDYYRLNDSSLRYIKTLEQKYPAYYAYKYDDEVPSLHTLQQYLANNQQSLLDYFIADTAVYILAITPATIKAIRYSTNNLDGNKLLSFRALCSNKEKLNSNYNSFIASSYALYKQLFEPLQIQKGSVIICPDNFLIPFEALCTVNTGNKFLINDYAFSYVYSARFLLKKTNTRKGNGNFIGFAPVNFQNYKDIPALTGSAAAMNKCAAYYKSSTLFMQQQATRANFLYSITGFSIINIFSHASADTSRDEPYLLLYDSIIKLSELQQLQNTQTSLVILSACETNAGKNAVGEGIYSLARGFFAAGIPSVAATLWAADEQSVYAITEKFHEYLSQGMQKDVALQKAKLFFMQHGSKEQSLPFYWANMILTGNTAAIDFSNARVSNKENGNSWWLYLISGVAVIIIAAVLFSRKKRKDRVIT